MRHFFLCICCITLAGCGLDETLYRADKSVSREQASKQIPLPFPSSATNIYYVFHAYGMVGLDEYVRFSVDPKELQNTVSNILADHDKRSQQTNSYSILPVASSPTPDSYVDTTLLPMPWWNPNSITNGCYYSRTNDTFHVWVDFTANAIYVSEN